MYKFIKGGLIMSMFNEVYFDKFWYELCNYVRYNNFNIKNKSFTFENKKTVDDILSNASTFSLEKWEELYKKNKNNEFILHAIVSNSYAPTNIIKEIAENILRNNKNSNFSIFETDILFKSLETNIDESTKTNIIKKTKPLFFNSISAYTYDSPEAKNRHSIPIHKNILCPYDTDTLKIACDIYLNTKSIQKHWTTSPFRLIKDNDYVEKILQNPKCTETIYASIMNNCYLDPNIRYEAMQNANLSDIYFATEEMKNDVYSIAAEQYIEGDINPKTKNLHKFSKDEIKIYNKNLNFLSDKILIHLFTEAQQLDLINRLFNLHQGEAKDQVLNALLSSSGYPSVLSLADKFKENVAYRAYFNNAMNPSQKIEYVNVICENNKNYKNDKKCRIIENCVADNTLDEKSYFNIIKNAPITVTMSIAKSFHTPDNILDKIINNNFPLSTSTSEIDTISIDTCKFLAIINKVTKQHLTKEEFDLFQKELWPFNICMTKQGTAKKEFKEFTIDCATPSFPISFYKYENFIEKLPQIPDEKIQKIKDTINNYSKKDDISEFETHVLSETLDVIELNEYIIKNKNAGNYSWCSNAILEKFKSITLHNFNYSIIDNVSNFYSNINECFEQYFCIKVEEEERYNAISKHINELIQDEDRYEDEYDDELLYD
jgi:hypothetical protein